MKALAKIDKFYYVLGLVLLVISLVVIFTLRTIFSSLATAGEISDEFFEASSPRVDKTKIDKAIGILDNPKTIPLDL